MLLKRAARVSVEKRGEGEGVSGDLLNRGEPRSKAGLLSVA